MASRHGRAAQIGVHKLRQQEHLRMCCKLGDLPGVALALNPRERTWWKLAKQMFSYLTTGVASSEEPADLLHVYSDDIGNMAIHYIALGSKPTLTSTVMALFCIKPTATLISDVKRAELLRCLLDTGASLDLSAVNAQLQTPAHCAVQSRSLEVLNVLLTYVPANGAQRLPACITIQDSKGMRPLDVALVTQQWQAVRLLIGAGALQACPELTQAQRQLQQALLLPDSRRPSGALPILKGAMWKAVGFVWKQGIGSSRPPAESEEAPQDGADEEAAESAVIILSSPQQIYQHRRASVQMLAQRLSIGEYTAQQGLEALQWNPHTALSMLTHSISGADLHSASRGRPANQAVAGGGELPSAPANVLQTCVVCYEATLPSSASIPCGHHTCDECLKGILLASMDDGDLDRCTCPVPDCRSRMPEQAAQQLLDSRQLERYQHLAAQTYADRNPLMHWCPRPGCGHCVALDMQESGPDSRAVAAGQRRPVDVQCACGERFCLSCGLAPHEPAPCAAVKEWNEMLRQAKKMATSQSESWLTKNTKPCTGCGAPIQKNGGCNHITCSRCRGHFCWVCGRDWGSHGPATGGFYACNRFVPAAPGAAAAEPSGIRSFLSSLYGRMQDAAQQYRLEHYLRRYYAQECDAGLIQVSADWLAALLYSSTPATGNPTAAVGLKQLLEPAEADHARRSVQGLPAPPEHESDYSYLSRAAAEVVAGRRALANSYIAAYAMPWSDRKRQFEDTQGRLEAAVEQCSLPLALMPHIQAVSRAAAQHVKAKGSDAPLRGSLDEVPLDVTDGEAVRQQVYHALAVHDLADQIRSLTGVVVKEKAALLRMARVGC